jgi:hypothetical protein
MGRLLVELLPAHVAPWSHYTFQLAHQLAAAAAAAAIDAQSNHLSNPTSTGLYC